MKTKLFNKEGVEVWEVDLNEKVFNVDVNIWLIHRALVYQLSNSRLNIAHTKTRWERRWSTRKIYRQKWTWRARMWSNRSPLRKKWWVVFWPRNTTNFKINMNRKERRLALFSLLSKKVNDSCLYVFDELNFEQIKTKNMVSVLDSINSDKKSFLVALTAEDKNAFKSASNIPYAKPLNVSYLNIKDLLKYKILVLTKSSLEKVNSLNC